MSSKGGGRSQDSGSDQQPQQSPSFPRGAGSRGRRRGRGGGGRNRGGHTPTQPSAPLPFSQLDRTTAAPPETTSPASAVPSPSQAAPESIPEIAASLSSSVTEESSGSSASVEQVRRQVEHKLDIDEPIKEGAQPPPPESSKLVPFADRPGFGTVGRKCRLKANHFLVKIADKDLHHYDVTITPEITSKKVNREVISQLVALYQHSNLGGKTPAYDGRKSLYTSGRLPFESKDFVVKLPEKDKGSGSSDSVRREREFRVAIRFAAVPDLHHLRQFLSGSRQLDSPQETIQVLDIVLRHRPSKDYTTVGRSFFSTMLGDTGDLGDGAVYWKGYYQSLRPTQMGLSLNIDVSARAFFESVSVSDFVFSYLRLGDTSRPLSNQERIKIRKALRGLKVELNHLGYVKTCKITGVSTEPLSQILFTQNDKNTKITVVQYFREKYRIELKYTSFPALQSGSDARPIFLPMELCKIVEGQRYSKKLNTEQVKGLLRANCQRPKQRQKEIVERVEKNEFNKDKLVSNEFGIQVQEQLTFVNARILPPPTLIYQASGRESRVNPSRGQWNMKNKEMVNGGNVDFWTCVNFSTQISRGVPKEFCKKLRQMCLDKGIEFNPNALIPVQNCGPGQIEKVLVDIHKQCEAKLANERGKRLQLLIIILPDVTGSYGTIKRICETQLGIVSQCCNPKETETPNRQYLANIALKINVKVGGRNTVLRDAIQRTIPPVTDRTTIILGADVNHPPPGEDASPSIAAVVASMDWPEITKYRGTVSAQAHREEIIQDLYKSSNDKDRGVVHSGMIRELFLAFRSNTGRKPERIIFYRDGVSEGQFNQVLLYEMDAIRKACSSLEEGYLPPVTFVVVQKRHRTRLFPAEAALADKEGNILPGTVVDTEICHIREFDFYLNSHASVKGTNRPIHYHVLYDENRFNADQLQTLTYNLCYTYARCTRSVSIVPPAYYAHHVAFRARYYIDGETFDGSSSGVGQSGRQINVLPVIKDNVKDVMFYC